MPEKPAELRGKLSVEKVYANDKVYGLQEGW